MARQHYTAAEVRAMIGKDATPEEYEEFFQWIDSTEKRFTYEWVKDRFGDKDPFTIIKRWRWFESLPPEKNQYCPEYIAPNLSEIPREDWPKKDGTIIGVPEPMKSYMQNLEDMSEDEEESLISAIETALDLRPEYTVLLETRQLGTNPKHTVAHLDKLGNVIKKGWLAINSLREPAWWACVEVKSVPDYVPDFLSPPAPILKFDFPTIFDTKEEAQAENKRQIEEGERDADDEWEDDEIVEVWVMQSFGLDFPLVKLRLHEYGLGNLYTKEHGAWTFSQLQAMR